MKKSLVKLAFITHFSMALPKSRFRVSDPSLTTIDKLYPTHDFLVNDMSINEPIVQTQRVYSGLKFEKSEI